MTPLLLLHPLGSDGGFWQPLTGPLDRPVLRPDLPGHGASTPPPVGAGVAAYTDAVVSGLDSDGVDDVVAVGISLGGLVAQDLAARHPHRVTGLVLVDTVATYPAPFRDTWPQRAAVARAEGMAPLANAMEEMWFGPDFRRAHPEIVAEARQRFLATDPEGYARACEMLHTVDTTDALAAIGQPALVVCGDHDAPAFVEAAPALATALDGELHWLAGAQHASVLEQPQEFAVAVRGFLDERGLQ